MTGPDDIPCHCPTKAEHDEQVAIALSTSDLSVIADAREYLRLHFQDRRMGVDRNLGPATTQLPYHVLDKIERWAG